MLEDRKDQLHNNLETEVEEFRREFQEKKEEENHARKNAEQLVDAEDEGDFPRREDSVEEREHRHVAPRVPGEVMEDDLDNKERVLDDMGESLKQ